MCINKFLWTTEVHPSPFHGLIVYTGRFSFLNNHISSILQVITYLVFTSKYFLSYQTELPRFKPGGSHYPVILLLMVCRFHALV